MFTKNINIVFLLLIILSLGLNPFLSGKAFAKEESKVITNNKRGGEMNHYDKKDYYNETYSKSKKLQSNILYDKKYQKNTGKIIGEVLLGSIGSISVGAFGAITGFSMANDEGWFAGYKEAILGYVIGSTLGSSLGVCIIGTSGNETGSFGTTLGGSILGTAIGIGLLYISVEDNATMGFISFTLAQSAGATIAFNVSARKRDYIIPDYAILHFRKGKLNFSYPKIQLTSHPLQPGQLIKTVNLVSLEF